MSAQKLPRPHVFTPPDLTLRLDDGFEPRTISLVGRYEINLVGRTPLNIDYHFEELSRVPRDIRGYTSVDYVRIECYESELLSVVRGLGFSFLHTPDVFSEPFGVALSTTRAVTDLIEKHQPLNSVDLGIRVGRYLDDVDAAYTFTVSEGVILDRAVVKLQEAIFKCPK